MAYNQVLQTTRSLKGSYKFEISVESQIQLRVSRNTGRLIGQTVQQAGHKQHIRRPELKEQRSLCHYHAPGNKLFFEFYMFSRVINVAIESLVSQNGSAQYIHSSVLISTPVVTHS